MAQLLQSVTYASIRTYLAAIRHLHIERGFGDPLKEKPQLELLLKGSQKRKGKQKDSRLPVTPLILRIIRREVDKAPQEFDNILVWAMCCLGFYGFMRSGEFTCATAGSYDPSKHLAYGDIAINSRNNPTIMKIHLKFSKTDQLGRGIDIHIGATQNDICPIAAMLSYLAARGPQPGPLFQHRDGSPVTRQRFVELFRCKLAQAGVNYKQFAGHSFRIGAATTAAAKGLSENTIQTLGRWASEAYKSYIRLPTAQLAEYSRTLASD